MTIPQQEQLPFQNQQKQQGVPKYDPNDAAMRYRLRSGQADPWENKRYRRSESGRYEIQNDPYRAINQTDATTEAEQPFDYDIRQRRVVDQIQINDATALQGSTISAWNAQKQKQETEYASLYAEGQKLGGQPYYTGGAGSGWSMQVLDTLGTGEVRRSIVNAAVSMINRTDLEYSWGGGGTRGPSYGINGGGLLDSRNVFGFDCSGLVQYAYARAGISLGRHSTHQTTAGRIVGLGALKPGDLVGWGNSPQTSTHVAVYLGNGYIAEAANTRDDLRIRKVSSNERGIFGVQILGGS